MEQETAGSAEKLHLLVGRSLILDFPERMARVYVSNPAVLDAVTATAQELIVTAKDSGSSSLVIWTKQAAPKMYIILADVDISGLRRSLAKALPGDHIEVQADQGRIYLTGVVDSDDAASEAERLATVYSKQVINSLVVDPRHLPQVQLEVKIIELDRSKLTAFGINLFSLDKTAARRPPSSSRLPAFKVRTAAVRRSSAISSTCSTSTFLTAWAPRSRTCRPKVCWKSWPSRT